MSANDQTDFERIRRVIAHTFKAPAQQIGELTEFTEIPGWDSVGHIALMMELEAEFGVRFPTESINEPKTSKDILALIARVKGN
jgi:acyl carrier protein